MVVNLHDEVRKNQIKSLFVVGMFIVFVAVIGAAGGAVYGGYTTGELFSLGHIIFGLVMAVVVAGLYIAVFMARGSKMILKTAGAKEATRKDYPHLYHTTEAVAIAAGLGGTVPKIYVIQDPAPNAFATGFSPEKSYIAVTTGLLDKLNRQEVEGVIAHEMAHIKNRDIKVMLLAAGLVGATVLLADLLFRMFLFGGSGGGQRDGKIIAIAFVFWLALVILSPFVGEMIRLAISRKREYLADASGALYTRYPEGLASALEKISHDGSQLKNANKATAHLFISNPFKKKKPSLMQRLFSTHPPIEDRIARLRGTQKPA